MYRRFHDRFGTAGLIIGVIALIAALGGTAIAAGGLTGKQVKEVTKIAKKYAGKPGPAGPTGPAGVNGTNGKDGAQGIRGEKGEKGDTGANGTFSTEPLPTGQTLTGVYASGEGKDVAAISFPIRVTPAPKALYYLGYLEIGFLLEDGKTTVYPLGKTLEEISEEEFEEAQEAWKAACPGSKTTPEAEPDFLCIYPDREPVQEPTPALAEAADEFGVEVPFDTLAGSGTGGRWAVTAE